MLGGGVGRPKALEMEGGASTSMVAVAAVPEPPSVEVTTLVVLFCAPALAAVVPVTFTENVQEADAARVAVVGLPRLIAFVP